MSVSVIIPTFNEASNIERLIAHLRKHGGRCLHEIIVCDGGSMDNTGRVAKNAGARVFRCNGTGRAVQMNEGARYASGTILYFVHADTLPPIDFVREMENAVALNKKAGCFRTRFDSDNKLLLINAYFTRFSGILSGAGDQSLYIEKRIFDELGGFDKKWVIMEDFDMVRRVRKYGCSFHVIPREIVVSARKYATNSYLRVNLSNLLIFSLYKIGVKPAMLYRWYRRLLNPIPVSCKLKGRKEQSVCVVKDTIDSESIA